MIVTDPVARVQEGCVAVNVGADGVAGCAFKVTVVTVETHPLAFLATILCVEPAARPEKTNVAPYGLASKL